MTKAKTEALAQRVAAILKKTRINPKCNFWEGTICNGPSFKNFAIPNDPEKREIAKVIKKRFCWLIKPKGLGSYGLWMTCLFLKYIATRMYNCGIASRNGSEIWKALNKQTESKS